MAMNPYNQYVETQVKTVTPGGLIVMAYDGAIRCCRKAVEYINQHQLYEQNENLSKAQMIIMELMSSLNPTVDQQLAQALQNLYTYMCDRLVYANVHDDVNPVEEVIVLLTDLRAAWAQAELIVRSGNENIIDQSLEAAA